MFESVNSESSLLAPYRVLDLADEKGSLCGSILADLGADVIKIEPPTGDRARSIGPFYRDEPGAENSLFWWAYNVNKKSITLNLETADGRDIFLKLARKADFVIESYRPGYLKKLGIGYKQLAAANPKIVMTSISLFGQTGPYARYESTDFVAEAMGGLIFPSGDPDRPPVAIGFPQAYLHGGIHAAVGSMIAHQYRQGSGQGQYIDVSICESVVRTFSSEIPWWDLRHVLITRLGARRLRGGAAPARVIWACKDGYVAFWLLFGRLARRLSPLAEWMRREGMAGPLGRVKDWEALDLDTISPDEMVQWEQAIGNFFLKHTKDELYTVSVEKGIILTPVYTIGEVLKDKQLAAKHYWQDVDHPELGQKFTFPGFPYRFSEVQLKQGRAPLLGEHNESIYVKELGFTRQELVMLKEANVI